MNQVRPRYRSVLVSFMSYHHNRPYNADQTFTLEEMLEITPAVIADFFCVRAFGFLNPGPLDAPVYCRSGTLLVYKKSLSSFMPNKLQPWNSATLSGNPTKSTDVNEVIKFVKLQEVRRMGKTSTAKRPLTQAEFLVCLQLFTERIEFQYRYRYTCMMKFQYHVIGRSDDLGNFRTRDLRSHSDPRFSSFCIETKVYWSKNVLEERNCPNQILLGSYDSTFCLLLALSIYLEYWFSVSCAGRQSIFLFSDDVDMKRTPNRVKDSYIRALRINVFTNPEFFRLSKAAEDSPLGSHSLRKFAATWARSNGCNSDEVETRGRWKRYGGRVVDRYIDVTQVYIDAKVQKALCVGGPIKYELIADSGITKSWCDEFVVPGIKLYFAADEKMADVLALPLLYAALDDHLTDALTVPVTLSTRIRSAYERVRILPPNINPVQKVPLTIYRVNDALCMDSTVNARDVRQQRGNEELGVLGGGDDGNTNEHFDAILIQQQQLLNKLEVQAAEIKQQIDDVKKEVSSSFKVINLNLNRILIQAPRQATRQQNNAITENQQLDEASAVVDNAAAAQRQLLATLSPCPRNLFDLWKEYTHGIGGRKAAKNFTLVERGKNKCSYSRRKAFWIIVSKHVSAGYTSAAAIDRIHQAYGDKLSVTKILNLIIRDKNDGGHPNLQI